MCLGELEVLFDCLFSRSTLPNSSKGDLFAAMVTINEVIESIMIVKGISNYNTFVDNLIKASIQLNDLYYKLNQPIPSYKRENKLTTDLIIEIQSYSPDKKYSVSCAIELLDSLFISLGKLNKFYGFYNLFYDSMQLISDSLHLSTARKNDKVLSNLTTFDYRCLK